MSYLDPHLGYAHDHATDDGLGDVGGVPGFAVYGDPDAPDALRIVALGGSTTDPLDPGNWPRALQRYLANQGVPAVMFNGGVSGYSSNQELLKLIRDALPLEPDLVLSLSGINDLGFLHSVSQHPMVNPFQRSVLESVVRTKPPLVMPNALSLVARWRAARVPDVNRIDGVNFGPPVSTTPNAQWERNIRLAHAAAAEMGVTYLAFLQPVLGVGEYAPSPEDDALMQEALRQKPKYVDDLRAFYAAARITADTLPYVTPLVDVFAGQSSLYRDARHPNREGYAIIAEAIARELCARGLLEAYGVICGGNVPAQPTVEIPRPEHGGEEWLRNGSFEEWTANGPRFWTVDGAAERSAAATDGASGAALPRPRGGEERTRIQQTVPAEVAVAGRTVYFALDAMSATPAFGAGIYGSVDGEQMLLTRDESGGPGWLNHPGGGEWTLIAQEIALPDTLEPGSLRVVLMNRAGAQAPALIDRVSLAVTEP
jgi:lysophospholipase L1-like esterase